MRNSDQQCQRSSVGPSSARLQRRPKWRRFDLRHFVARHSTDSQHPKTNVSNRPSVGSQLTKTNVSSRPSQSYLGSKTELFQVSKFTDFFQRRQRNWARSLLATAQLWKATRQPARSRRRHNVNRNVENRHRIERRKQL